MSAKTDVNALAELDSEELDRRVAACAERVETRMQRARDEDRDLLPREADLMADDRLELQALKSALELRSVTADRIEILDRAIEMHQRPETRSAPYRPTLLVSERHLAEHAAALREGVGIGFLAVVAAAPIVPVPVFRTVDVLWCSLQSSPFPPPFVPGHIS
jgi:hypothetical protein